MPATRNSLTDLFELERTEPAYSGRIVIKSPDDYGDCLMELRAQAEQAISSRVPSWSVKGALHLGSAIYELGMNAAREGNRYAEGSYVDFFIYTLEDIVSLVVRDQGDGFPEEVIAEITDESEDTPSQIIRRFKEQDPRPIDENGMKLPPTNGCNMGFYIIRQMDTFNGLYIEAGSNKVRVYFDMSKAKDQQQDR